MAVCEYCWTEASRRAALSPKMTPELYKEVCLEAEKAVNPSWHPDLIEPDKEN